MNSLTLQTSEIINLPGCLAVRLKHPYGCENLSFAGLKGLDSIVVQVLRNSERYEIDLALIEKRISGHSNGKEPFCCEPGCQACISIDNIDIDESDVDVSKCVGGGVYGNGLA